VAWTNDKGGVGSASVSGGNWTTAAVPLAMGVTAFTFTATDGGGTVTSVGLSVERVASIAPAFTAQPADQSVSAGSNATFTAVASGTPSPTYQWQYRASSSASWSNVPASNPYGGVTTTTLIVTGATTAMSDYQYQCLASNTAQSNVSSTTAVLTVTGGNSVPTTPINQIPSAGATDVARTPVLTGNAFSDPDSGDSHAASQWQVLAATGTTVVWDSGEDVTNRTSVTVPAAAGLVANTTYRWQARYKDSRGGWSSYSVLTSFTTAATTAPVASVSYTPAGGTATTVARGDTTPSAAEGSDYGVATIGATASDVERTFTITNTGTANLTFGTTAVTVTTGTPSAPGTTASVDFAVTSQPATPVGTASGSNTTTFKVKFSPKGTTGGTRTATVVIASNETATPYTFAVSGTANAVPVTPVNQSPAANATNVALTPTLTAGAFSDPDTGDTHAGSQWQVLAATGTALVWDSGEDAVNKLSVAVPTTANLLASTTYRWQVRNKDNRSGWSAYSTLTSFTTGATPVAVASVTYTPWGGTATAVARGDTTPSLAEGTDFGVATIGATASDVERTFTITNTGTANLTFGATAVTVTTGTPAAPGATASADFTVTAQPATPVGTASGSNATTFKVKFSPKGTTGGTRTATVVIASNETATPYAFAITGAAQGETPPNDNFANAIVLAGNSGTVSGTTVGATRETGEGNQGGLNGRTVWYRWTPTTSGAVTFTLTSTAFAPFVNIFPGTVLADLGPGNVGGNHSSPSVATMQVTAGTIYHIAVVDAGPVAGTFTLAYAGPATASPLWAHYRLDGDANDGSGNSRHGTADAGVSYGVDRIGTAAKAALFTGAGGIDIPNGYLPEATVACWVKIPAGTSIPTGVAGFAGRVIFDGWSGTTGLGENVMLRVVNDGSSWRFVGSGHVSASEVHLLSTATIKADRWYHVALTCAADGANKLYVNGVLDASSVATGAGSSAYTMDFKIGVSGRGVLPFIGLLDDIQVHSAPLTGAQIADLAGFPALEQGLVAYYQFEGAATDSSGTGNNGTANANVSYVAGRVGQAAHFNGSSMISVPDHASLDLTTAMTFAAWVRIDTGAGGSSRRLFDKNTSGSADGYGVNYYQFGATDPRLEVDLLTSGEPGSPPVVPYSLNEWVHLAIVANGGTQVLYRNGVEVDRRAMVVTLPTNALPLVLGAAQGGSDGLQGDLDEFRLYSRALSLEEVRALAGVGGPVLIGHWKFDGDAQDAGPLALHGVNNGGTFVADRNGTASSAIRLRGRDLSAAVVNAPVFHNGDFVRVPRTNGQPALGREFSLACWVRPLTAIPANTSTTGPWNMTIMSQTTGSDSDGGWSFNQAFGAGSIGFQGSPHFDGVVKADTPVPVNSWTHVAITYAADKWTFFVNGSKASEGTRTYSELLPVADLVIGAGLTSVADGMLYHFDGDLDDVRIYQGALSAAEISALAGVTTIDSLNFNDNQMPAGWQQGPYANTGSFDFANGRMNANTSSSSNNFITRNVTMPAGTTRLEIKYRGNTGEGGLGAAQQVYIVMSPSLTVNCAHGYGTWAAAGQMLGYIGDASGRQVEQAMTRVADTYDYTVVIEDGAVAFRGVRVSDGAVVLDLRKVYAGLHVASASQIFFNVNNWGSSVPTWIDDVQIRVALTASKTAPVVAWPTPAEITYGMALTATQLNASAGGVAGTFAYTPAAGVVLGAGSHPLSVTFTPTDTATYSTVTQTQTLLVNKAALTGTAENKTKVQGAANPALTISYAGFVVGETKSVITEPTITTTATTGSPVGTYPITLAGGSATNYTLTLVPGTLTVTPKIVPEITWPTPAAITYGTALTPTQLNANAGGVAGVFAYSPAAGAVLGAGSRTLNVTFTPTDAVTYATATGTQTLTVNKAALTATADNKSKLQGAANPALTVSYTGFVNGDTAAVIDVAPTASTTATTASPVGTYPISLIGGSDNNYALTLQAGTLTVIPVEVPSFATRTLPVFYVSGADVVVKIQATPATTVGVYAVEDSFPIGWTFKSADYGGAFDGVTKKVKWGPFFDNTARTLTYVVTAPANATGTVTFGPGTASADGVNSAVGGMNSVVFAPYHPADNNPADWRITINEVTAYGAAWKRGDTWGTPPIAIEIAFVTRAGSLWKNGELYRVDSAVTSAPLWWVAGAWPTAAIPAAKDASSGQTNAALPVMSAVSTSGRAVSGATVTLNVTPDASVGVYAVEESIPAGLTVSAITGGGAFDSVNRKVKWGPFFDSSARTLNYTLSGPDGNYTISGVASMDGANQTTTGQNVVVIGGTVPTISAAPLAQTAAVGASVTFTVVAAGSPAPTYQWRKNGAAIIGATNAAYSIANAQATDAGNYSVVASNNLGSATSAVAALSVGTVGNLPVVTAAVPNSGPVGRAVQVNGSNFVSAPTVRFNGVQATLLQWATGTNSYALVAVPAGATTGPISIQTTAGTVPSNFDFVVTTNPAAPTNNSFASAQVITGASGTVSGTNVGATLETGEPNHTSNLDGTVGAAGGSSIWYRWVAPASGPYLFTTQGSSPGLGALIGVYSGDAVNALTRLVASRIQIFGYPTNVSFVANVGATYYIAVDGRSGNTGDIMLGWSSVGAPTIASYTPIYGVTGANILVSGANLGGLTAVRFNGVLASSFGSTSGTSTTVIYAGVPAGATTGPLTVETAAGTVAAPYDFYVSSTAPIAPVITTQPVAQTANVGGSVSLVVVATGAPAPVFQWRKGGANVTNATSATLVLSNVQSGDAGTYTVVVANSAGSVTSGGAVLTVSSVVAPAVTAHPANQTIASGGNASFTVGASGSPTPMLQWQVSSNGGTSWVDLANGSPYSGVTSATLTITGASLGLAGTQYRCIATNTAGVATSNSGVLTVSGGLTAPTILTPPPNRLIGIATGTTIPVVAGGTPPLNYVWKKNGTPLTASARIMGETTATLSIGDAVLADSGPYSVTVTNAQGSVTSSVADGNLTVVDARPTQAVSGAGYLAGGTVVISNTLTYSGTASGLGWSVTLPPGWSYASGGGGEGDVKPAVGTTNLLEWSWTNQPPSPVSFSYTLNVPAGTTGDHSLAALVVLRRTDIAGPISIVAKPDPLVVQAATTHSTDTSRNFSISLVELTRVIELYNTRNGTVRTGAYAVATTTTEDGFAIDPARAGSATVSLTRYHSADTSRDGRIGLVELTRVIELFNYRAGTTRTGDYHVHPGSEDGFAPGPASVHPTQ
jgi:hypothetical protein